MDGYFAPFARTCLLWFAICFMPVVAMADDSAQPIKIAVVSFTELLQKAPQALSADSNLKARFLERETALAEEQKGIRALEVELKALVAERALNDDEQLARERELRDRRREYSRAVEDFNEEVRLAREQEILELQRNIRHAIGFIREREQIDLVLSENDYIVASKRLDITPLVMEHLQQKSRETAAEPTAAGKQE